MAVFFEPWVGVNYNEGGIFRKKILVIGNSHYCGDRNSCQRCGVENESLYTGKDCKDFTKTIINTYLDYQESKCEYEGWMKTFSNFEKALNDKNSSEDIWNSISFYNYLQVAVPNDGDKTNSNKTYNRYYDDYCKSEDCLWSVISDLKPDCIIVWGRIVWNHIGYRIEGETGILTKYIRHPSMGFSIIRWHQELSECFGSGNS